MKRRIGEPTPREAEAWRLLARGMSNSAMAAEMGVVVKSVDAVLFTLYLHIEIPIGRSSHRRVLAANEYWKRERRAP